MPRREIATSPLLVSHAVLVGLTPLIPIPFLDDIVKAFLERRLTSEIARSHGVTLSDDQLRAIAEGPGESVFGQLGRGVLLLPLRLFFRKIFFVLEIKRASDAASACYHRGYLLDLAFSMGASPPARRAADVRAAIDATLLETDHSPLGAAFRVSFEGSKALLRQALTALVDAFRQTPRAPTAENVAHAVEGAEHVRPVDALTDRLRRAAATVPESYFDSLEALLRARLGTPAR
ncbi:MAG: hypothetical protein JNL21_30485 [Myxococcales bacterium]|nr:hypothetical protein [Myxococcales bacterium]